jgi:hypothetical protein
MIALGFFIGVVVLLSVLAMGYQEKLAWGLGIAAAVLTSISDKVLRWTWEKVSTSQRLWPRRRAKLAKDVYENAIPLLAAALIPESDAFNAVMERSASSIRATLTKCLVDDRNNLLQRYVAIAQTGYDLVTSESPYVEAYVSEWKRFSSAMSNWYRPDEFKRQLISEATSEIKRRAIEPALQLFANRLAEVRSFSQKLGQIDF